MQFDLFSKPACNHLPLQQRIFEGEWLVCGRCREKLRLKDYRGEEEELKARERLKGTSHGLFCKRN